MRKHVCRAILVIVFMLLVTPIVAYADVLIELENDFYNRNRNDIVFLGRSFFVNGADGYVPVMEDPGSKHEIGRLQNGEITFLQYSCLYNGEFWGFSSEFSGWISIDQLLVLYDNVAFEEDHFEEIYPYDGDFAAIKEVGSAIAWSWPGATAPMWTFEGLDTDNLWVVHAYRDEQGREWGLVTYLFGYRNIWFCLDDPLNSDIAAFNPAPPPMPWVSDTEHTDIARANNDGILIVIIVLVAVLVAGTAILIRVFWKPQVAGEGEQK